MDLSNVEINKIISKKCCKVMGEYGEAVGYIIDDIRGIIYTSFHIVGTITPLKLSDYFENRNIIDLGQRTAIILVLKKLNLINDKLEATRNIYHIETLDNLINEIDKLELLDNLTYTVNFNDDEIIDIESKINMVISKIKNNEINTSITYTEHKIINLLRYHKFIDEKQQIINDFPDKVNFLQNFSIKLTLDEQKYALKNDYLKTLFDFISISKQVVNIQGGSPNVIIEIDNIILQGKILINTKYQNIDIIKKYAFYDVIPIQIIDMESKFILYTGNQIKYLDKNIEVGEKVYFGGYPLSQNDFHFSTGMISAIDIIDEGRITYTIEAPIVPGNSGSPIFIQRNGIIYVIGIINSEITNISDKMYSLNDALNKYNYGGSFYVFNFNIIHTLRELSSTMMNNISTGKGIAYNILPFDELLKPLNYDTSIDIFSKFIVRKPRICPINQIRLDAKNKRNIPLIKKRIIKLDSHWMKHIEFSKKINSESLTKRWKGNPATFFSDYANKDFLLKLLCHSLYLIMQNNYGTSYINVGVNIGIDEDITGCGAYTNIIELYGSDEIGYHIRPIHETRCDKKFNIITTNIEAIMK